MRKGNGALGDLPRMRDCTRKRESSWDKTGGNLDFIVVPPGTKATLASIQGAGCITHIWMTTESKERYYLRKVLLRMYWDGEKDPSVEVPIGDFFGAGHAMTKNFMSLPLTMSPRDGKGFNCFFPMPFAEQARIEVVNQGRLQVDSLYYYIDYEQYDKLDDDQLRFHATWTRESPTDGIDEGSLTNQEFQCYHTADCPKNLTGEGNYVILEAEGKGHYVGCILNIHNLRETKEHNWIGEGDDMIFIDGEKWPPSLHGTGTEDYFNAAWCPQQEFCAPYHGIIHGSGPNFSGKTTFYRFHIEDPVYFRKSIKVTIEHGHNNLRSDDYSSTAYWYQTEPHKRFPAEMLPVEKRLPLA